MIALDQRDAEYDPARCLCLVVGTKRITVMSEALAEFTNVGGSSLKMKSPLLVQQH